MQTDRRNESVRDVSTTSRAVEGHGPDVHTRHFAELAIIRALRAMDVSIPELTRILEVRRSGLCNCLVLKESISAKMASIEQRISELSSMKEELARLLERWQDCGGSKAER